MRDEQSLSYKQVYTYLIDSMGYSEEDLVNMTMIDLLDLVDDIDNVIKYNSQEL